MALRTSSAYTVAPHTRFSVVNSRPQFPQLKKYHLPSKHKPLPRGFT